MYICEVVPSIRNKNKINVYGYLMVKGKKKTTHIIGIVKNEINYDAMDVQ